MLKKLAAYAFISVFAVLPFFAEYNRAGIPDSAEIRSGITDAWLEAPVSSLKSKPSELKENSAGTVFQIRMEERMDSIAVIVAPRSFIDVDIVEDGKVSDSVRAAVYPECSPGSWVLYRNKKNGEPQKIRWYFNTDSDVYVQFEESQNRTVAQLVVCGLYAAHSVPVGIEFTRLYSASFADVLRWTKTSLPWEKVSVLTGQYHEIIQMAQVIRENIPLFDYTEDICYDSDGTRKFITTGKKYTVPDKDGNPVEPPENGRITVGGAGFLKWIADGIVKPLSGSALKLEGLAAPTVLFSELGKNGVISQEWNLTLALDWTRNLASQIYSVRAGKDYVFSECGVDVEENFFSGAVDDSASAKRYHYVPDSGYPPQSLKALLYVLSVRDPGWFYLAAIRQQSSIKPDELVFNGCAALFPYFDDAGKFKCAVFMNGGEVPLEKFISDNSSSFIHLERVRATDYFFPVN